MLSLEDIAQEMIKQICQGPLSLMVISAMAYRHVDLKFGGGNCVKELGCAIFFTYI